MSYKKSGVARMTKIRLDRMPQLEIKPSALHRSLSTDSITNVPDSPVSGITLPATVEKAWTKGRIVLALLQSSLYYYVYICVGFQNGIIGPLITHQQKRANVTANQIGWILTARGFGLVFSTLVSGFLFYSVRKYDDQKFRFTSMSLNRVLVVMLLMTLLTMFAIPFSTSFTLLLVVYFLQGATSGVCEVGCNLAIANVWRKKVRPFMQALHFFAAGGSLVFPLLIAQIFTWVEDVWAQLLVAYVLCGSLSGIVCIPLMLLPSPKEPRFTAAEEKKKAGAFYYLSRGRIGRLLYRTFWELLSFSSFIFLLTAVLKGIATGVYSNFGALIFQYAQRKDLGSDVQLAYLTTSFWATFAFGRLAASLVESLHLCKVNVPFCALLSGCVGGCVVSYVILLLFHNNMYGIWGGAIMQGLFCAPISAAAMVLPQTSFRIPVNAASTSMVALGSTLGELTVPTVSNLMSSIFQEDSMLVTNFSFILIGLLDVVLLFFFGKLYMWWKEKKRDKWYRENVLGRIRTSNEVDEDFDDDRGVTTLRNSPSFGLLSVSSEDLPESKYFNGDGNEIELTEEEEEEMARERRASDYMYFGTTSSSTAASLFEDGEFTDVTNNGDSDDSDEDTIMAVDVEYSSNGILSSDDLRK